MSSDAHDGLFRQEALDYHARGSESTGIIGTRPRATWPEATGAVILRRRRGVPFISQLDAVECGAASLAMVLGYHNHHAPLPEVREACGVSRDGVNALAMLSAAERYGLQATAYTTSVEQLTQLPMPAILHWDFNHFVVLEEIRDDGSAVIVDPARGRHTVTAATLARSFTGAALTFSPTPALTKRARKQVNLGRYREWIRSNARPIGLILACSVLMETLALVIPVGQQRLVDQALVAHNTPLLWKIGVAVFAALFIRSALTLARGYAISRLQVILDIGLLGNFMRHAVRLPIGFFLQRTPGDLHQRLESNSALGTFLGSQVATSLLDVFLLVGYAGLMFLYEWRLALVVASIGAIRVLIQLVQHEWNRKAMAAELTAMSSDGATLVASLEAVETLRATSAEGFALRRWNDSVVRRALASLPRMELQNLSSQSTLLLNALGVAAVSTVAGLSVLSGRISIGVFSAFLTLQALFLAPLGALMANLGNLQSLAANLTRLDDVLEAEPEHSGSADASNLRGEILLDHVSFRYSAAADWVLRDISVHIRAGETVAIVGASGAGKSTLARLLLGLLQPSSGKISFDGTDLRDYDLDALRRRMGIVLQENELLTGSVLENISLNDPSMSKQDVEHGARLACIDQVIESLPFGYATRLGARDSRLSGGERQRICLARAIAHRPAVLVLDEATSALDEATQSRVHANLRSLHCTRIVIAHRLATVRDADRLLVLDRGHVVQQGTFAALQTRPGVFRDLVGSGELLRA